MVICIFKQLTPILVPLFIWAGSCTAFSIISPRSTPVSMSSYPPKFNTVSSPIIRSSISSGTTTCLQSSSIPETNDSISSQPTAQREEEGEKQIQAKCPFSMSFPRYQVPLTRGKEAKDKQQQQQNNNFFSNFSKNVGKNILMQTTYKQDVSNQNFMYVECHNNDKIKEYKAHNIHAVATFWKTVHDYQLYLMNHPRNNSSRKVLALPDASFQTIRGLVEILEWYQDALRTRMNMKFVAPVIHATMDSEASIPVVVFTSQSNSNSNSNSNKNNNESHNSADYNPSVIQSRIQSWVKRLLVEQKICPFTKSIHKSGQGLGDLGVPVGGISYPTSKSNPDSIPLLMADTWNSILDMITAGPGGKTGISSILLAAPGFDHHFELWAGPIFAMLEACVSACQGESQVGLVCFHPQYKTPDGSSWPGFGHMHSVPRLLQWVKEFPPTSSSSSSDVNDKHMDKEWTEEEASAGGAWQRRTPHAVINVLRADQLEVAEGRRQTGKLYSRNIRVLIGEVGLDRLEQDLESERSMQ